MAFDLYRHVAARTTLKEANEANIARRKLEWLQAEDDLRQARLEVAKAEAIRSIRLNEYTHATGAN